MDHAIGPAIGARIKSLRRSKGLTALELARRVGVTENAIRKIEAGDSREPRFSTGVRIAEALEVRPEFIATGAVARLSQPPELAAVLREIRQRRAVLEREGVQHVSVFGSVARGDARADSDVDVLIDKALGKRFSLFSLVGVQEILQEVLGRKVDVLTRETLKTSRIRKNVEPDIVRAF